ncbi:MAG: MBL fold metallo-hydrolase [Clostridiaceae bacterium]|nr:MBL fold metallo-hydrolase [Clostridiaceae bacterium]
MKLHIFGSCSGTEPFPGRHHVGFAFEHAGALYWFDAGECCSYTAHTMGVDLMKVRKIVISHTHMDHIGGLGNLFWTIRKLDGMRHTLENRDIDLYIPDRRAWDSVYQTLSYTEGGFVCDFRIHAHEIGDGLLFDDRGFRVTALHNHHLPHEDGTPWRSFGFLIECEGRRIVYSGDTKGIDDYAAFLPCDLLLMESGHHHPPEVAATLLERGLFPGTLAFIHHGRDLLDRREEQITALDRLCPGRYIIYNDAETFTL